MRLKELVTDASIGPMLLVANFAPALVRPDCVVAARRVEITARYAELTFIQICTRRKKSCR